jgi:hypothetical protein
MQEGTARVLFRQIVSGLDYMHVRRRHNSTEAVSVKDRKGIESPKREKEGKGKTLAFGKVEGREEGRGSRRDDRGLTLTCFFHSVCMAMCSGPASVEP